MGSEAMLGRDAVPVFFVGHEWSNATTMPTSAVPVEVLRRYASAKPLQRPEVKHDEG